MTILPPGMRLNGPMPPPKLLPSQQVAGTVLRDDNVPLHHFRTDFGCKLIILVAAVRLVAVPAHPMHDTKLLLSKPRAKNQRQDLEDASFGAIMRQRLCHRL